MVVAVSELVLFHDDTGHILDIRAALPPLVFSS